MPFPAAHEPAFIVNSKLGADAASTASNRILTSSPDSRSTSAGSLSPSSSEPAQVATEGEIQCGGLPDYDYPVPLFVRNTFIDAAVARPISLDEFFEERRVHSCPVDSPPGLSISSDEGVMPPLGGLPPSITMMDSVMAAAASASAAAAAAAACWMQPLVQGGCGTYVEPVMPSSPTLASQAPVLRLADALADPELGSPAMPTIGSAGHRMGDCKPCAFYHTKGCGNGTQCPFCHLCPAGEKKRRQREKGAVHREMKRLGFMPEA